VALGDVGAVRSHRPKVPDAGGRWGARGRRRAPRAPPLAGLL